MCSALYGVALLWRFLDTEGAVTPAHGLAVIVFSAGVYAGLKGLRDRRMNVWGIELRPGAALGLAVGGLIMAMLVLLWK